MKFSACILLYAALMVLAGCGGPAEVRTRVDDSFAPERAEIREQKAKLAPLAREAKLGNGLAGMKSAVEKFNQGAHQIAVAQMNYFNQVQTAECMTQFYNAAFRFSMAQKDVKTQISFDLLPECQNLELTDAQMRNRQKLMDTITFYADALENIAVNDEYTRLSQTSRGLSINSQSFVNDLGFSSFNNTDRAILSTAVATISSLIFDHEKFKDVKTAAGNAQKELAAIIEEIKSENNFDAEGLKSKAITLKMQYQTALLADREQRGQASFLEVAGAHRVLQSILVSPADLDLLNNTLDALVAANASLASATETNALGEISDLVNRAEHAVNLFKASK